MPIVHLVRHGEVENPGRIHYGRLPGFGLSELGRAQALEAARHLVRTARAVGRLVSSPLDRARETADILRESIARARGASPDVAVDERATEAGSWREGLPRSMAPIAYLSNAFDPAARAKSEQPGAIADRMRAAVLDVVAGADPAGEIVLVSHQFPIWMARVAFERRFGEDGEWFTARAAPWLFVRDRCAPASVTSLAFEGRCFVGATYWEPR